MKTFNVELTISEYEYDSLMTYARITKKSLNEVISEKIDPKPVNWCSDDDYDDE